MKAKKVTAIVISAALIAGLAAGCGSTDTSGTTGADETVDSSAAAESTAETAAAETDDSVVAAATEEADNSIQIDSITEGVSSFSTLDPRTTSISEGLTFFYSVYQTLFQVNGMGAEMTPMLADGSRGEYGGYDHEEGTGDYTVYIHDNITDSAGNPFTASDVAYAFDAIYAEGKTSGWEAYSPGCVEVVDDTTVIFHFSKELTDLGEMQGIWCRAYMFTEAGFEASPTQFASDACGTGPYEITDYVAGSSVTIEARGEDYWNYGSEDISQYEQQNVKTIKCMIIGESTQYVASLKTGEIEVAEQLATSDIGDFLDGGSYSDQYSVYQMKSNMTYYVMPNCNSASICSDPNFRKALFYAIDAEGLISAMGGDTVATTTGAFGSDVFADYNTEWDSLDNYNTVCDTDLAQEYLAESGYNGETLKFMIMQGDENCAQVIQGMLLNVGINCEIEQYDIATFYTNIIEPDMWDFSIGGIGSSDYVVNCWSHLLDISNAMTGMTINFVDDPEWQDMLDTCKSVDGHTTENLDAWWQHAVDNAYIMGLYVSYNNFVYPSNMKTLLLNDKNHIILNGCTYSEE